MVKTSTALRRAAVECSPRLDGSSLGDWLDVYVYGWGKWGHVYDAMGRRDLMGFWNKETHTFDRAMCLLFLSHYFKDLGE